MVVQPGPDFVPIHAEPALPPVAVSPSAPVSPLAIEVKVAGAVVCVLAGMDVVLLTLLLRAVRASAGAA